MVWNKGMPVIWWYVMKEFNWKWKQMDSICNYAQNTSLTNSWLWNGLFEVSPDLTRIFGIYGGQYAPHNASWVQGFRNVGAESKGSYPWYVFQAASPWGITAFYADLFADMGYRSKNNVFPHFLGEYCYIFRPVFITIFTCCRRCFKKCYNLKSSIHAGLNQNNTNYRSCIFHCQKETNWISSKKMLCFLRTIFIIL